MTFDPKIYNSERKKNKYSKSNHNKDSIAYNGRYAVDFHQIPKLLNLLTEIPMFSPNLSGWSLTFLNSIIDNVGKQYEMIKSTQSRQGAAIISEKQYLKLWDIIMQYQDDNNINDSLSFQFKKIKPMKKIED